MSLETEKFRSPRSSSDEEITIPTRTINRSRSGINSYLSDEVWKLIISFLFIFSMHMLTCISVIFVNDRLPDRKKYPPLPDLILDNITYIPWGSSVAETSIMVLAFIWCSMAFLHKRRLVIMRRMFALTGTMYFLRCICITITSIPCPDVHKECDVFPDADIWNKFHRAFLMWRSMGLKVMGTRTCGDYIFSGHTLILTMINLFIVEYTPGMQYLHITSWTLNLTGMLFILSCRGHYSIDVFLAFYITTKLFAYYHTLINNRSVMIKEKRRTWICFPLFSFLEEESDNTFTNEFEWPVPRMVEYVKSFFNPQKTMPI